MTPDQNEKEWVRMYQNYSDSIYQYIFYMMKDKEAAKDILQDTFFQVYKKYHTFHGGSEKSWLYTIARNTAIDYLRKKKPVFYLIDLFPSAHEKTPEDIVLLNETEKLVYLALSKVKRSYREVIILRKMKDFSIKETADILGCTESQVKVNLNRGMSALRKELLKEGYCHEII
ncbi:RNA polymerase sigma factor [Metabacillus sp. JX24]|uniref:RNA polymerase sigma factor n=1 Tax=Metabacillus sp. JX24 TaxID=3240759 RepID=UPI00350F4DF2